METNITEGSVGPAAPRYRRLRAATRGAAGIVALTALLVASSHDAAAQAASRPFPALFGGIQVNEPDHDRWVAAVSEAGLNTVQVTLYARHQAWNGPQMYWEREAPWVVSEIRTAHQAGLRTILVLRVALEHGLAENRHLWHGMIWPRDEDFEAWADNYRRFALWGAALAAREGVSALAIGNELSSLTSTTAVDELPDLYAYFLDRARVAAVREQLVQCAGRVERERSPADLRQLDGGRYETLDAMLRAEEQARRAWTQTIVGGPDASDLAGLNARRARHERFWRDLIPRIRDVYPGPVTYGANFDQYDQVGFWDLLDAVSLNAYFPLGLYGQDAQARLSRMEDSWRGIAGRLNGVAGDLPVILLELGWTRRLGSTVRPYSYDRVEVLETASPGGGLACVHWATQPDDPRERVAAMQGLANVVRAGQFQRLRGLMLWKLTTRPEHRAIEPFAAVLQPGADYSPAGWGRLPATADDALDRAYVGLAAQIASEVSDVASWDEPAPAGVPIRPVGDRRAPAGTRYR